MTAPAQDAALEAMLSDIADRLEAVVTRLRALSERCARLTAPGRDDGIGAES